MLMATVVTVSVTRLQFNVYSVRNLYTGCVCWEVRGVRVCVCYVCVWCGVSVVSVRVCCVCVSVCVVSIIVKHPPLPPCAIDGRSRNPLYYYYYYTTFENGEEKTREKKKRKNATRTEVLLLTSIVPYR